MADDKNGREKQARDAEKRDRQRDVATELERGDETEPPDETESLTDFETAVESLEFPATGVDVVTTLGDHTVEVGESAYAVKELVPETEAETFDSPAAVRVQVRNPTVAAAMKRIVEASDRLQNVEFGWTQRKAYELTFREMETIDPDDDDGGIVVVADWILERLGDNGQLPTSRAVRRRAAKFCRANGYQIRDDEWLGA